MNLAKVWPLKPGLTGVTVDGHTVLLQPGVPGYMEYATAIMAETQGKLQLMAGQTPQSLKPPSFEEASPPAPVAERSPRPTPLPRKKKVYAKSHIRTEPR